MELQELRVFTAVVENNGFARASSKLGLTQSAVSQSIANLERKLDVKVLERTIPVKPTPIGAELLQHAHYILDRENTFFQDLKKLKLGHLQTLSLAVDHLANNHLCPQLLTHFSHLLPEAKVEVQKLPAREMIQAIHSGQCELGLGPFQKSMEGLKKIKIRDEVSYLVCSKRNKYLKLYEENPLAFLNKTTLLTSFLDEAESRPSKKKIRDYFKSIWQVNDINLQIQLIREGLGTAFLNQTILEQNPLAKNFIILKEVPFGNIRKPYGLYYSQTKKLSEAAQAFIEIIENKLVDL